MIALCLFAALSAAEALAGWLIWYGYRFGTVLTIALLPLEAMFWASFAPPVSPIVACNRLWFLYACWSALR